MNIVYIVLGSSVAAMTLLGAVFGAGRAWGRRDQHDQDIDKHLQAQDDHLARQDEQIAELHRKLDDLRGDERG